VDRGGGRNGKSKLTIFTAEAQRTQRSSTATAKSKELPLEYERGTLQTEID